MSREAFEKWAADQTFLIKAGDDYINVRQMAWKAWQAALESQAAQTQVPDLIPMEPFQTIDAGSKNYKAGWNACRAAMLTASQEKNKIDRD